MVVFRYVPAQDGRDVMIRLDYDSALASRPLARQIPGPANTLPGIFSFSTASLARTRISSTLVTQRTIRTTRF